MVLPSQEPLRPDSRFVSLRLDNCGVNRHLPCLKISMSNNVLHLGKLLISYDSMISSCLKLAENEMSELPIPETEIGDSRDVVHELPEETRGSRGRVREYL